MKLNSYLLTAMMALSSVSVYAQVDQWKTDYPKIEASIQSPKLKDKAFSIEKYGAKTSASAAKNQKAINNAIKACAKAGGGRVVVSKGTWHTGAVTLLSGVNLHLEEGAVLQFDFIPELYPVVETRWEGLGCYNLSPMIYANGAHDIAITGKGTVNGGGTRETWWTWTGVPRFGWKEGMYTMRASRAKLQQQSEDGVDVKERRFDVSNPMRPQLVNFMNCERVLIEDVTLLASPFWVVHPVMCKDFTLRGVTITNDGPNGDGCDPESCDRVLIENCHFKTGDDCIAIKSGRNRDGRMWNVPCQNVIVRKCKMEDGHGGIVVGSEISGGFKNLFVEDCTMDSPNLERVIRIKTNTCRGGVVENIFARNIEVGRCREAVVKINLNYESKEKAERGHIPTVRNVYIDNVNCKASKYGYYISGLEESAQIENINISNCTWTGITDPGIFRTEGKIKDLNVQNVSVSGWSLTFNH